MRIRNTTGCSGEAGIGRMRDLRLRRPSPASWSVGAGCEAQPRRSNLSTLALRAQHAMSARFIRALVTEREVDRQQRSAELSAFDNHIHLDMPAHMHIPDGTFSRFRVGVTFPVARKVTRTPLIPRPQRRRSKMTQGEVRSYTVNARSTGTFGRVLCNTRKHHFVVDGPVQNGCPGEAITPAEFFLTGIACVCERWGRFPPSLTLCTCVHIMVHGLRVGRRKGNGQSSKTRSRFADAVGVFDDPHALSMRDTTPHEERFIAVGADFLGRILVVVYTYRGERIRIISARRATSSERKTYEQGAT